MGSMLWCVERASGPELQPVMHVPVDATVRSVHHQLECLMLVATG